MVDPYRVLVIEDDLDVALYTKTVLEKRLGCIVVTIADPREVMPALRSLQPDVVITDIELPGSSGLELVGRVRQEHPAVPVIVMTAHASVDYAVSALRKNADEFLTKPVASADLVAHVSRLASEYRRVLANAPERQVVLAVGAHPDDVEIGIGGILAAHRDAGDAVTILTLSRGARSGGIQAAWAEGSASAALIGATLILEDLSEADLAGSERLALRLAKVIADVKPTTVYVHSKNDQNMVHRALHDAVALAAASVRTLGCYQSWTATPDFRPIRFIPIEEQLTTKLAMLACFAPGSERNNTPLDPDTVVATARYWSRFAASTICEPLEILRDSAQVA